MTQCGNTNTRTISEPAIQNQTNVNRHMLQVVYNLFIHSLDISAHCWDFSWLQENGFDVL